MMNYEEFKKIVAENIKEYLPTIYAESEVSVQVVQKNNETLYALTVNSPKSNVCPTIYLEEFFEDYKKGIDLDKIMKRIAEIRVKNEVGESIQLQDIISFEKIKNQILPSIVGVEGNEEFLKDRPYVKMADLAVVFRIMVDLNECNLISGDAISSISVTNQLLETWGVTEENLFDLAKKNMVVLTPSTFKAMTEVLAEMMPFCEDCSETEELLGCIPEEEQMYILSNDKKFNGATAILDDEMMGKIVERFGENFIILPSSVHEMIILPVPKQPSDSSELENMVQEVNMTIDPQMKLSDHIYRYDSKTHTIYRA